MFIEDLDRFSDTEIFVKLRELNEILNGYEVLNNEVKLHLFMQYEMIYSKKKQKELSFLIL